MTEPGPDPDGVDRLLLAEAAAYAGRRTVVVDDVTGALVGGLAGVHGLVLRLARRRADGRPRGDRRCRRAPGSTTRCWAGRSSSSPGCPRAWRRWTSWPAPCPRPPEPDVVLLAGGLVRHLSRGHERRARGALRAGARDAGAVQGAGAGRGESDGSGPRDGARGRGLAPRRPPRGRGPDGLRARRRVRGDGHRRRHAGRCSACSTSCRPTPSRWSTWARATVSWRPRSRGRCRPRASWRSDVSAAAVRSTRATAEANGLRTVDAVRANGLEGVGPESVDLVVCNPPFHRGTALDRDTTPRLFGEVGPGAAARRRAVDRLEQPPAVPADAARPGRLDLGRHADAAVHRDAVPPPACALTPLARAAGRSCRPWSAPVRPPTTGTTGQGATSGGCRSLTRSSLRRATVRVVSASEASAIAAMITDVAHQVRREPARDDHAERVDQVAHRQERVDGREEGRQDRCRVGPAGGRQLQDQRHQQQAGPDGPERGPRQVRERRERDRAPA